MKRAGALLGVVVMVAAAFFVRTAVTGDDADGDAGNRSSSGPSVVCPADLADVCEMPSGLDVSVQSAGATADALLGAATADALDADAWVVTAAWADLVIAERARTGAAPLFEVAGPPLASTPVALAIWADRDAELATRCDVVDWRCIAEQVGSVLDAGNPVRPLGPPIDTAAGLTVAAVQMAALVERADFAANDFDGAILSLADRLARGQSGDPLRTMRTMGPGAATAVGALGADTRNLSSNFGTIVPRFDATSRADVVLVIRRGASVSDDTRTALAEAFRDAGWDDPDASADDGLPDGSVLAAIRTIWNDAR